MKKMRDVLHQLMNTDLSPGEILRGMRIEAGISQEEMASITGIQRTNISALENGRIPMTSHYAEIFGAALKLHPADILYPNRQFTKGPELLEIEKKADALTKNKNPK